MSPLSYLAVENIYNMENKYDIEVLWQPFSAKACGRQVEGASVNPDKLSYIIEEVERFTTENNLPLNFPANWPANDYDPTRITRGALIANDMNILMEYNYKVFHKCWGLGEDPNTEHFLSELTEELDIDTNEFITKISSSDTRNRVKGIYERGQKFGVFDTPTFIVDGKRLYGVDKIYYLNELFEKEGLRKKK